jgi:hypothetical protein
VAKELGLPKLTFQVIRRSISTWSLHDRMGTLKDLQGVLRHTRAETTADVYTQIIPEGVRRTVEAIDAKLTGNADSTENRRTENRNPTMLPSFGAQKISCHFLPILRQPGGKCKERWWAL